MKSKLVLEGVLMDAESPVASISGNFVRKGEIYKGYLAKEIGQDYILLEKKGRTTRLELFPDLNNPSKNLILQPEVPKEITPKKQKPNQPPPASSPLLNILTMKEETQAMAQTRQLYAVTASSGAMEMGEVSLKQLAERGLIPKDLEEGKLGAYVYSIKRKGADFEVYADPADPNSILRHFIIDQFGTERAERGKPATSDSPRV